MFKIANDGAEIASTDYWQTEHAGAGLCYLSANAGTWRLLVPKPAESMITEMRTGRKVSIEPSLHAPGQCWDVVFEDGSDSPFSLAVDKRQVDRSMSPGRCRLAVWTEGGKILELDCRVRT